MKIIKKHIFPQILSETQQSPITRKPIIKRIEKYFNKTVISFFSSFNSSVSIDDNDAVILEEVLQNTDIKTNGLILIINSPGGDGLAAERIINVCRTYSKNKFEILVPNMAKSAATMIGLGSNLIYMSNTSELGPIDPQILLLEDKKRKRLSVHSILKSYEELFDKAVNEKGRLEPYLQQLNRYDHRDIEELKRAMELSESIAIKSLKNGMMKKYSEKTIKSKIEPFLTPITTKVHGRAIFADEAKKCGLKIKVLNNKSRIWQDIWELYVRTDFVLQKESVKVIESADDHYHVARSE